MTANTNTKPLILLFKGKGIISALIRWQTRSKYSHAAILMPDGNIIESWQGTGVRIKKLNNWINIDKYSIPSMTEAQWDNVIKFALAQLGCKYDYWAILRFITRKSGSKNARWFCSELVFRALQGSNISLLNNITADKVSPGLLSLSPMLELEL